MKRSNFGLHGPIVPGPINFPDRPLLHAPAGGPFAFSGRRAYVTGSREKSRVRAGLAPARPSAGLHPGSHEDRADIGVELELAVSPTVSDVVQLRTALRRLLQNGIVEHCLVPLDLAAVLWQWETSGPGTPIILDVEISVAERSGCVWNHNERVLEIRSGNGNSLALICSNAVDWELSEVTGPANTIQLRVAITSDDATIRFAAIAAADEAEMLRTLNRLHAPQPLLNARRTATLQQDTEQPGFETPERALDDALLWSAHVVRNSVIEAAESGRTVVPDNDAAATALTLLALGDFAGARGILQNLGNRELSASQLPLYLLLAARYSAWTADFDFMYSQWSHVIAAAGRYSEELTPDPLVRLAVRELADAAASLGYDAARAKFTSLAARGSARTNSESAVDEFTMLFADRSADRIANVRRHAERASPYTFASFVYGLVGIEPDAPKNRIRIAPAVPREWDSLELTNVALGDARIDLRYQRTADRHTFRIAQSAGAMPVRVVFEPLITVSQIDQILLDGQPAQLNVVSGASGVTTPVQLDLDYERVLEIVERQS